MSILTAFPTYIYQANIKSPRGLNSNLLNEISSLSEEDQAGLHWSDQSYPGGYTSYGSLNRLQEISPTFKRLESLLNRHVLAFAKKLGLNSKRALSMTDCWANIMTQGVHHGWHLHPQSVISGSYYVSIPKDAAPIKFEDPRLDRLMAAPLSLKRQQQLWLSVSPLVGECVLFESHLRHEVPIHRAESPRVSISFNYSFF